MQSPEMGGYNPNNVEENGPENYIASVKERALRYVEDGKLKEALDSAASDLSKDSSMDENLRLFLSKSALILRNNENLSKEDVIAFINRL